MIKRIKVHTEQALNEASYRFPGNYGVEKFLELFSGIKRIPLLLQVSRLKAVSCCRVVFRDISAIGELLIDFFPFSLSFFARPICRGRLQRLLFGVHVHVSGLWRRNVGSGLDGWFEKRRRRMRKERPLPRQFEELEYGHCDAIELRQTRPTRRLSRHAGSRNRPQFRIASMLLSLSQSLPHFIESFLKQNVFWGFILARSRKQPGLHAGWRRRQLHHVRSCHFRR